MEEGQSEDVALRVGWEVPMLLRPRSMPGSPQCLIERHTRCVQPCTHLNCRIPPFETTHQYKANIAERHQDDIQFGPASELAEHWSECSQRPSRPYCQQGGSLMPDIQRPKAGHLPCAMLIGTECPRYPQSLVL